MFVQLCWIVCYDAMMLLYDYVFILVYVCCIILLYDNRRLGVRNLCETNREIRFGSVARASEAACACEAMLLPRLGSGSSKNAPRVPRVPVPVPFPLPSQNHSLFCVGLLIHASRCWSMLNRFPWLLVASRCFPLRSRCFPLRLGRKNVNHCAGTASSVVPTGWAVYRCKSMQIVANRL